MHHESNLIGEDVHGVADYSDYIGGDLQRDIIIPALFDVIGHVRGKKILELYCGAGHVSRRLAALGALVTAVDTSERLLGIADEINRRENENVRFVIADPTDLSVLEDSHFDEIVCNMGLMVTRELGGTIAESARLIKLGGRFVFSVLHPCFCMPDSAWVGDEDGNMNYLTLDNYFTESWWNSEMASNFRNNRGKIKHRTLSRYVNAFGARGFSIRRVLEPKPTLDAVACRPHLEVFERLPVAMIVEAVFPYL